MTGPVSPHGTPGLSARLALGAATVLLRATSPLLGQDRARWLVVRLWAFATLVYYSLRAQYARALLGVVWTVATPLLFLAVYLPLFTYVFKMDAGEFAGDELAFPLYVIVGFILWNAFSDGVQNGASSLVMNMGVVRHAPSPPALLPTVKVGTSFVNYVAGVLLVVVFLAAVGRWPGLRLLLLPLAVGLAFLFTWGLALLAAALTVYLGDVLQMLSTVLLIEFFACPLLYPLSVLPAEMRLVVQLNPLSPFLALARASLLPTQPFRPEDIGFAAAWAVGAWLVGAFAFRRLERGFTDA
jgi:ABC-type polysaccharide/polyol phosphate export permease